MRAHSKETSLISWDIFHARGRALGGPVHDYLYAGGLVLANQYSGLSATLSSTMSSPDAPQTYTRPMRTASASSLRISSRNPFRTVGKASSWMLPFGLAGRMGKRSVLVLLRESLLPVLLRALCYTTWITQLENRRQNPSLSELPGCVLGYEEASDTTGPAIPCNGLKPCNTCIKRNMLCNYRLNSSSETDSLDPVKSPIKRRHLDEMQPSRAHVCSPMMLTKREDDYRQKHDAIFDFDVCSPQSNGSGPDEEATVDEQGIMLQDPTTGRLLYVGDSAALSYLQLIRMVVEDIAGESQFTLDPSRHKITEPSSTVPESNVPRCVLPDRETADVLVESFFINTHGLIEVFDRQLFGQTLSDCYTSPLTVESSDLCLVHLVLSIGLVMATPELDSPAEAIVSRLRSGPIDRAEMFFRSAKYLADALPGLGLEDADFWSVRALALMAFYKLAVSKRNAAYAYTGMAVRSAYALGIHKVLITTMVFDQEQFSCSFLGPATAISEGDCTEDSLEAPPRVSNISRLSNAKAAPSSSLDATVAACQIVSRTLKEVYTKCRVSTNLAQDIGDDCNFWACNIHPALDSSKLFDSGLTPSQGMAILHTQLFGSHSIILLTRPFFSCLLLNWAKQEKGGSQQGCHRASPRMERLSEACVSASTRTVSLIQVAFESNFLSQRNPFVLYFLFTATLVILSNEFASLHDNAHCTTSIANAIDLLNYCAASDFQASQLVYITTSFHNVIHAHAQSANSSQSSRQAHQVKPSTQMAKGAFANFQVETYENEEQKYKLPLSPRPGSAKGMTQTSHAPMNPRMRLPAGLTVLPDAGPPVGIVSPASSHTPLSQSMAESSGRQGSESMIPETFGGVHGIEFEMVWEMQNITSPINRAPALEQIPGPPMQQPGRGRTSSGFRPYEAHGVPSQAQAHPNGVVINPNVLGYSPADYLQTER
ncbi:hypothetical protein G7046_g9182 [Stylonectria norvegica]|nr:hypothetical protein G7046_g9182 [Stylonectria norvegica]